MSTHDSGHVDRHAEQVHDHDRLGAWRDLALDVLRADLPGLGIHVGPHDRGACHAERDRGGAECVGRDDDFVAGADPAQDRGEAQRVGGVVDRERVVGADVGLEVRLELAHVSALGLDFGVAHDVDDGVDLAFAVAAHPSREVHFVAGDGAAP